MSKHADYEEKMAFNSLPRSGQALAKLVAGVTGKCRSDSMGMEKATSVRLDEFNYPRIKALTMLSDNSMTTIINDMLEVGFASMYEKLSEEEKRILDSHSNEIFQSWLKEEMEKNNVTNNG